MVLTIFFVVFQSAPYVPAQLEPWREWVLSGHEQKTCPSPYNDPEVDRCACPSQLELMVENSGATFQQDWDVYLGSWVRLPGDAEFWPQLVTSDGREAPVISRDGLPYLFLNAGSHRIRGQFLWDNMPNSIGIPKETWTVRLELNGQKISDQNRNREGRLWLAVKTDLPQQANGMTMRVFRLIHDRIPTFVETRIQLDVSGQAREVLLGKPLFPDFIPHSLRSKLNVRLEDDGNLFVQVRPGHWEIVFLARATRVVDQFSLQNPGDVWPETELWSLALERSLRSVTPSGLSAVDASQTEAPEEWREFPCFVVNRGGVLTLNEKDRGLNVAMPEELEVERRLWLDFDGRGWTFSDQVSGYLQQNWRLSMVAPYQPGKILLDGVEQLITVDRSEDGQQHIGTELRQRNLSLKADGRIEGSQGTLPASGWETTLHRLRVSLHLPPGYFLFGAIGPDAVEGDWLHSWHLWDFFLVLLVTLGAARLWGRSKGAIALGVMVLFHNIPGMSPFLWIGPMIMLALLKVLPAGKLISFSTFLYRFLVLILVINLISLSISQTQTLLYPHLAYSEGSDSYYQEDSKDAESIFPDKGNQQQENWSAKSPSASYLEVSFDFDDTAESMVQTGPGIPNWRGHNPLKPYLDQTAELTWNGPVDSLESMRLWILPPFLQALIIVSRLILMALLFMLVAQIKFPRIKAAGAALVLIPLLFLTPPEVQAQSTPSPEVLSELQSRLLKPAECYPNCASIPSAGFELNGENLVLNLEIHCVEQVSVPLPTFPNSIENRNGGSPSLYLEDSGQLWAMMEKGVTRIKLNFDLKGKESLSLSFPLKPHRGSWRLPGWALEGIHADGAIDSQIELHREVSLANQTGTREIQAGLNEVQNGLSPFASVVRTVILDHKWRIITEVRNQNQAPLVLQVPLMPRETVVTAGIRVENNNAILNLPGGSDARLEWQSTMEPLDSFTWTAPESVSWTEEWKLAASHRWHATWKGSPAISFFEADGSWMPSWSPRPGESLEITVQRPIPLEGQTLTIQSATLSLVPGHRVTNCALFLELVSSIGGEYAVKLPENIQPRQLQANGSDHPFRQENGRLMVPINPGANSIEITWQEAGGLSAFFRTPEIDLGSTTVNLNLKMSLPYGRWLLITKGPAMGPAIRFWGILFVLIVLAFAMGNAPLSPLKPYQWLLLGLGLMVLHILLAIIPVFWFFALARRKTSESAGFFFNLNQIFLAGLSFLVVGIMLVGFHHGLLGQPNMYMAGPGNHGLNLQWYQERTLGPFPSALVFSLPALVFHILMLAWSLWAARSMIHWTKWAWTCYSANGLWHSRASRSPQHSKPPQRRNATEDKPETQD